MVILLVLINGFGSFLTVIHEMMHVVGVEHVFTEPPGSGPIFPGQRGSIMDYIHKRLADDEPIESDRRQYGFSRRYSWDHVCAAFNKTWELYSGTDGTCWADALDVMDIINNTTNTSLIKTYEEQICNRNGIVDPWEECDVGEHDTRCCKNCKLAEWATCDEDETNVTTDSQCCENCIAAKSEKRCRLATDIGDTRSGICFRGKCVYDWFRLCTFRDF
eukprot:UN04590